jgi:opacity protein-like surface antigen
MARSGHEGVLGVLIAAALLAAATACAAAPTVYRWVDEQGKVHYSDIVPDRYRATAKPVDAGTAEPDAEQRRQALERARLDQARAAALAAERQTKAATGAKSAASAASAASTASAAQPAGKRPAQLPNDRTDCDTWQRLFLESSDCFAPYRTVRGATRPEAFDACNVVSEPPPRCRPQIP